jgi:cell division transport system permease protein
VLRRYLRLHASNFIGALGRLFRHPVGSALTILVIAIALALPAGLRVLVNNARGLSESWQGAVDFAVYLDLDVSRERAAALASEIGNRDDVAVARLIDKDEAMAEFKAQSGFGEALDALEENPLPHTIVVRPAGGATAAIEALAASLAEYDEADAVQLDTAWVARLRSMLLLFSRVVDLATILLGSAVVIGIGNTIRLEINNRGTEIEVTKLVGGSDAFIRRPFLYLGVCYGLIGAIAAALLVAAALALMQGPVADLAALYASGYRLTGLDAREMAVLLGGGALLGWAGAWLAAARHLRAIEPT